LKEAKKEKKSFHGSSSSSSSFFFLKEESQISCPSRWAGVRRNGAKAFSRRWRRHGYCTTNSRLCIVKGITRKRRLIQIMMIKFVGALCMYISEWILSRHRVICLISISYCQSDEYNVDFSVEKELNKRKGAVHKEVAAHIEAAVAAVAVATAQPVTQESPGLNKQS
jgi:hypothetical protein